MLYEDTRVTQEKYFYWHLVSHRKHFDITRIVRQGKNAVRIASDWKLSSV